MQTCAPRRCAPAPTAGRDFHRVDLLWTLLVIGVAVGAIAADYASAAAESREETCQALATVSLTASERLHMLFDPLASLLRTTQTSLAFIPRPWDLHTWGQVAAPIVAASPSISAYVMTELVSRANRSAWEARMSAKYSRPIRILEYARTSEWAGGCARGARARRSHISRCARARAQATARMSLRASAICTLCAAAPVCRAAVCMFNS